MIIDAEGHPGEWARRVEGLGGDRSQVAYWQHMGGALVLEDYSGLVDMIVVDSAAYFTGEDGHDEWAAPALALQRQAVAAGVPMLVLAHVSKSQPEKAYGSGYWHNVPRASYHLSMDGSGLRTLACKKATDLAGLDVGMTWDVELSLGQDQVTPVGLSIERTVGAIEVPTLADQVRAFIEEQNGATLAQITEALGASRRSVQRALEGCPDGQVRTGAHGVKTYLPW